MMNPSFLSKRRVAYWECDMQGWVFHAHYFTWMDDALLELWGTHIGAYSDFVARGLEYVVAEVSGRFVEGARFEQEIELSITLEPLTRTSMTSLHTMRHNGKLLTEGRVRHVCVDGQTFAKAPWPDDVRAKLERFARPADEPEPQSARPR